MNKHLKLVSGATAIVSTGVAFAVVYPLLSAPPGKPLLDWRDPAVVARGEALYDEQCISCHGPVGSARVASDDATASAATVPSHDADGHTWEHPDFALVQLTKSGEVAELCRDLGESNMPVFEQALSDRQIVDVLSYIKSTWSEEIRARQDEINLLYEVQNKAVREHLDLAGS